jgi:hypothetical protein
MICKKIDIVLVLLLIVSLGEAQIKVQPYVGFGNQSIHYSSDNASVDGVSGLNVGLDAFYYINQKMAVGGGIRMVNYGAIASVYDQVYSAELTDEDGDDYVLSATFNGIEEDHHLTAIEIPLFFRYQHWLTNDIMLFGSTGPVLIFPGSMESKFTSGTLATEGYFPEWNVTIDDVAEMGFYERDIAGDGPQVDVNTSLAWNLAFGAEYFLSKKLNLFMTVSYQSSLSSVSDGQSNNDIMSDAYTFNGSMAGASDIKLTQMGVKIGVTIDITPVEKAGVKSIR